MAEETEIWRPGSFTKNFSWGSPSAGLSELHELIELGFDGKMEDVPREVFRQRVRPLGRPEYIPINFFLFNRQERGTDYLVADELVCKRCAAGTLNWQPYQTCRCGAGVLQGAHAGRIL